MLLPPIMSDEYYLKCINLAMIPKHKKDQRYGSILVADGEIIGAGYNRAIVHSSFGKLERVIKQGYANHAEIEAMNDALAKGFNIEGTNLYVARYFPIEDNKLFIKDKFTCVKCPPYMIKYGIKTIFVPAETGWLGKSPEQALEEGKNYINGTLQNRLELLNNFEYYLDDLNLE